VGRGNNINNLFGQALAPKVIIIIAAIAMLTTADIPALINFFISLKNMAKINPESVPMRTFRDTRPIVNKVVTHLATLLPF